MASFTYFVLLHKLFYVHSFYFDKWKIIKTFEILFKHKNLLERLICKKVLNKYFLNVKIVVEIIHIVEMSEIVLKSGPISDEESGNTFEFGECSRKVVQKNAKSKMRLRPQPTTSCSVAASIFTSTSTARSKSSKLVQSFQNKKTTVVTPHKHTSSLKHTAGSTLPGARCGEIFVANNARQWTFICTFCNKSTRDIGDFICHIKMKHLEDSDVSSVSGGYYENDVGGNDDAVGDNGITYGQDQDYLDCGSYLDVNVHTEAEDLNYNGQEHYAKKSTSGRKSQDTFQYMIKHKILKPHENSKKLTISKGETIVDLIDDDDDEDDEIEEITPNDTKEHISAHTSNRNRTIQNEIINGDISQQNQHLGYNDCNEKFSAHISNEMDTQDDLSRYDDNDEDDTNAGGIGDDDFDNQLLLAPSDSLDTISGNNEFKTKRRQIRGTAYCALCNKTFQYYSLYRNHMIKHSNETPFKCSLCKRGFKSKQAIRYHMNTHQKEKQFNCQLCHAGYYTENQFITHVLTHENATTFPCMVCGEIFRSDKERDLHLSTHTDERPFRCEFCNKLFRLRHHLSNHLKLHRQYRCDYCKEEFTSAVHLRKPYACTACGSLPEVKANANVNRPGSVNPLHIYESITMPPSQQSNECDDSAEMVSDDDEHNYDSDIVAANDEQDFQHHSEQMEEDDDVNSGDDDLLTPQSGARATKGRYPCKFCTRSYSHISGLNYHVRNKH